METAILLWLSFLAGVYAPLGSPCVLVLYPGYISFLAGRSVDDRDRTSPLILGIAVAAGVICAMAAGGLVIILVLQGIGAAALAVITAALYCVLLLLSILLIFDIDYWRAMKTIPVPRPAHPLPAAFLLGLASGIIILPCNAAPVAVLLALAASAPGFTTGLGLFLCFGLGMTLPLIIIAGLSQAQSQRVMEYLAGKRRIIRILSGLIFLMISVWYLAYFLSPEIFLR